MNPHLNMPELPEVQTIADELRPHLLGRSFTGLEADWAAALASAPLTQFRRRLVGQRISEVGRRGKYLQCGLASGDALLIHLMMTGRLSVVPDSEPYDSHTHVRFALDDGKELRLRDVRKLGRVHLVADPDKVLGHLGPEPMAEEFTLERFGNLISRRRGRLKSLLLNQRFLAGLGNIYCDEVLFTAGLHPLRGANSLTEQESERLHQSIQRVLAHAVAQLGTTLGDGGYRRPDGQGGSYQNLLQVYGRAGEPCPLCRTPIQRIVVGNRGTHLCPRCQR